MNEPGGYADLSPKERAGKIVVRRNARDGHKNEAGEYCYDYYAPNGSRIIGDAHIRDIISFAKNMQCEGTSVKAAFPMPQLACGDWRFLTPTEQMQFDQALHYISCGGGKL